MSKMWRGRSRWLAEAGLARNRPRGRRVVPLAGQVLGRVQPSIVGNGSSRLPNPAQPSSIRRTHRFHPSSSNLGPWCWLWAGGSWTAAEQGDLGWSPQLAWSIVRRSFPTVQPDRRGPLSSETLRLATWSSASATFLRWSASKPPTPLRLRHSFLARTVRRRTRSGGLLSAMAHQDTCLVSTTPPSVKPHMAMEFRLGGLEVVWLTLRMDASWRGQGLEVGCTAAEPEAGRVCIPIGQGALPTRMQYDLAAAGTVLQLKGL